MLYCSARREGKTLFDEPRLDWVVTGRDRERERERERREIKSNIVSIALTVDREKIARHVFANEMMGNKTLLSSV